MLRQTHGQKAVKSWDSHRQLYNQPFKQIEKLGYQGQLAARMNIISMLYMQQTLGSLLTSLEDDIDKDTVCQTVKDLFAMSTKSLDQAGRTGAYLHLIRRRAAGEDSGLANVKELNSKCQYLPLTDDGLFGQAFESCLEKRKEQKDQLNDLLPEFVNKDSRKRRFDSSVNTDSRTVKVAKQTDQIHAKSNRGQASSVTGASSNFSSKFSKNKNNTGTNFTKQSVNSFQAKKDGKAGKTSSQTSWGSFRIPNRKDS